jgi:Pyruvate/2-oxoacid:ferredoxin oxidoreductase delta subunit
MIPSMEADQTNLALAEYRTFTNSVGHYNYAGWVYLTAGNPDALRLEVVYPNDVVPPLSQDLSNVVNYRTCTLCGIFYENCPAAQQTCSKLYLAQGGTMNITRADRATAGRIQGSASAVRFNEWNLSTDLAVPGGGCVIATSIGPIDVGWNADGGAPPP